jgi:hypothetical protein
MLDERSLAFEIASQPFRVATCVVGFSLSVLEIRAEPFNLNVSALAFGKLLSQFCLQALSVPQLVARLFPH